MPAQPVAGAEFGEGLVAHVERLTPELPGGDVVRAELTVVFGHVPSVTLCPIFVKTPVWVSDV